MTLTTVATPADILGTIRQAILDADLAGDVDAKHDWLDALREENLILARNTPNPADCVTPLKCQGLTCCPRQRACSE